MPRSLITSLTAAERFELTFERKIQALVDAAIIGISQPDGLVTACALETAVSKPPAIVIGVRRTEEAIDRTGLWDCACGIEFRFKLNDTGYLEGLYAAVRDAMGRETAESALTVAGETVVTAGSMLWDAELQRELAEGIESRFYAWTMVAGLIAPA